MVDLKQKREAKNMTQDELAAKVGVKRQGISAIECGKALPSWQNAQKIAKLLDFDWSEFYQNERETNSSVS